MRARGFHRLKPAVPTARHSREVIGKRRIYVTLLVPASLFALGLVVAPLVYAAYLSTRDFDLLRASNSYAGFQNYARIISDRLFWLAFGRTLFYVGVVVIADFLIGFSAALFLYRMTPRAAKVMRGIILLPMLLMPVATALLWRIVMFNPPYMIFNRVFSIEGSVLAHPRTALWGIILAAVWGWAPWVFLPLLAALEGLPAEAIEAAEVEGANFPQIVRHVIMPLMKPVIVVVLSLKAVESFSSFEFPWIMTAGGPSGSSHLLSTYIYQRSFQSLKYGYGTSMTMIMVLVLLLGGGWLLRYVWGRADEVTFD